MKRILSLMIVVLLLLSFSACSNAIEQAEERNSEQANIKMSTTMK